MKVYGIKNCNTVKKALDWLDRNHIAYEFHDFKKLGVSAEDLQRWSSIVGWESLLNKKGTTWRSLTPEDQQSAISKEGAFQLMENKTSVIKRPVVETDDITLIGFDESKYESSFL